MGRILQTMSKRPVFRLKKKKKRYLDKTLAMIIRTRKS